MPNTDKELIGANSFILEWNMEALAFLKEVSGLETTTEVIATKEAGPKGEAIVRKIPGGIPKAAGQVTVKYHALKDDPILTWREEVIKGDMKKARRNVSVVVYGTDNAEVLRFNLKDAWPSKYSWSALTAGKAEAMEITVVLDHEELSMGK